eukprot:5503397-Pyramimonas_sp.AAC.1
MSQQEEARLRRDIAETPNGSTRAKFRRQMKGQIRRGKLWSPFDKRTSVKGSTNSGAVVRDPAEVLQLRGQHGGAVFCAKKSIRQVGIDQYLDKHAPTSRCPSPDPDWPREAPGEAPR